ncbi:MAG TPA: FAD-dependent thymidylate synthase [Bacteroidales bacterium]|nr:FAD-dependent thymidylate synthase [Bacteroidales bacterium]
MKAQINVKEYNNDFGSLVAIKKFIEFCGRLCYNSRDKITPSSYDTFYDMLLKRGHLSPLAHGTVYLTVSNDSKWLAQYDEYIPKGIWKRNPWIRVNQDADHLFITTNMRFIETYKLQDWLQYISNPCYMHTYRYTFEIEAPISCTRELNRHAYLLNGICEKSTRYIDMSGDTPYIITKPEIMKYMEMATTFYDLALLGGAQKQEAREVLPLGTMSTAIYTAFEDDWEEILSKRSSDAGAHGQHPMINEVANLIYNSIKDRK